MEESHNFQRVQQDTFYYYISSTQSGSRTAFVIVLNIAFIQGTYVGISENAPSVSVIAAYFVVSGALVAMAGVEFVLP